MLQNLLIYIALPVHYFFPTVVLRILLDATAIWRIKRHLVFKIRQKGTDGREDLLLTNPKLLEDFFFV